MGRQRNAAFTPAYRRELELHGLEKEPPSARSSGGLIAISTLPSQVTG
jgi:hypothetical protein